MRRDQDVFPQLGAPRRRPPRGWESRTGYSLRMLCRVAWNEMLGIAGNTRLQRAPAADRAGNAGCYIIHVGQWASAVPFATSSVQFCRTKKRLVALKHTLVTC